jgi:hypothetical protein
MTGTVRHPIFARLFDRVSPLMEREVGPRRDELLAGLSGRVVEIGAGNGANFAHYPPTVPRADRRRARALSARPGRRDST